MRLTANQRRTKGEKSPWTEYHPSTVVASVRPRGMKDKPRKDVLRAGVQMLYGRDLGTLDQNIIDAIAVGHCHIAKVRQAAIISGEAGRWSRNPISNYWNTRNFRRPGRLQERHRIRQETPFGSP